MKKVMAGVGAALAMTIALPATASADVQIDPLGACVNNVGPIFKACVSVDPDDQQVQSLVYYGGNKYLLKVDPRTGEVSLCRYTPTGYDCPL